jgi:glutamyl-tRNA reductase
VADLGSGSPHSLDELPRLLIEADIIISSTGANHLVIDYEMVSRAVNRRSGRPLFLVDIALPRDIESRCSELDDVYLFEIDDLQQMVNENLGERQQAADSALLIVNDATIQFERWLDSFSTKPVLAGFHDYLDDLIGREANRTFSREIYSGLSQDQYQGIQSMMTAIKSKINSDAAKIINNPPDGFFKEDLAEALRTIFQLSLDSKD